MFESLNLLLLLVASTCYFKGSIRKILVPGVVYKLTCELFNESCYGKFTIQNWLFNIKLANLTFSKNICYHKVSLIDALKCFWIRSISSVKRFMVLRRSLCGKSLISQELWHFKQELNEESWSKESLSVVNCMSCLKFRISPKHLNSTKVLLPKFLCWVLFTNLSLNYSMNPGTRIVPCNILQDEGDMLVSKL